jgi:hypothetical protein
VHTNVAGKSCQQRQAARLLKSRRIVLKRHGPCEHACTAAIWTENMELIVSSMRGTRAMTAPAHGVGKNFGVGVWSAHLTASAPPDEAHCRFLGKTGVQAWWGGEQRQGKNYSATMSLRPIPQTSKSLFCKFHPSHLGAAGADGVQQGLSVIFRLQNGQTILTKPRKKRRKERKRK